MPFLCAGGARVGDLIKPTALLAPRGCTVPLGNWLITSTVCIGRHFWRPFWGPPLGGLLRGNQEQDDQSGGTTVIDIIGGVVTGVVVVLVPMVRNIYAQLHG